ncbi:Mg2+ or Co2+ transporter protein [Mycoavidus cysteinexigens]|uniref:Magnesium and cobalt efflux protein CorC n=1 Tax=Mycoavidus cysteinexigens TaxID=1553431 RepID=A0A2Z6EXE4_9BURK|nr:transporter associated domain-containing protein [Mycoavidus cysteinexigens]BBE10087.1 Mg2+ or Co2+ transporter protein [Mycoavidus cysteinexigens]GAM53569.1 magnesium and cobalt efflux protein CorC [bacterium endosymbiont of Mortierella elongata FMR23-6]GLR00503.1 cation transporter [Mycoavidus cysteinexigens]
MNDVSPSRKFASKPRSLLERLTDLISPGPDSRSELLEVLQDAHNRNLIDADSLSMIEGVFQVTDLCARDIMVPRAQIDAINIAHSPETFIPFVLEKEHSRYPVYESNRDHVIGILLAKDLLRFYAEEDFDVRGMLRPAVFIPESKPLNVLLRDFRVNRNHIAMVVDEYGGIAGLITIEDVLEQIVGDIEDEYDFEEEEDNIIGSPDGRCRVRALTEIVQFNKFFGTQYSDEEVDTIGGLITHRFARVPHRGETVRIDNLIFEVLRSDARQVHMLLVRRTPQTAPSETERH